MIVVKLMGGLGNQMFQYAAGRCLSYLYKTDLKLDLSFLNADSGNAYTQRKFELHVFNINAFIATQSDLDFFNKLNSNSIINTLHRKLPILFSSLTANENGHHFHKEFFSYPKNTYLNGFWQSQNYFLQIRDLLLNEFTLRENLSEDVLKNRDKITQTNSVSLHIRRGDYVSNKNALDFHGLCSIEYYNSAIEHIVARKDAVNLFVFSDDMTWVKQHLKTNCNVNYIEQNEAFVDLHLMSLCKHNIIANSSFSWWGAWLNTNTEKMVIAPKKWFANTNAPDIYPDEWIKM